MNLRELPKRIRLNLGWAAGAGAPATFPPDYVPPADEGRPRH